MADGSLWNNKKAIDNIDETYELDLTLDVWNVRAVRTCAHCIVSS